MSATPPASGAPIEVHGGSTEAGSFVAVDDLGFDVEPGRITRRRANGAGKTTSLRMILDLVNATSGTAAVDGHRYVDLPGARLGTVGAALRRTSTRAQRPRPPARAGRRRLDPLTRVDRLLGLTDIPAAARKPR